MDSRPRLARLALLGAALALVLAGCGTTPRRAGVRAEPVRPAVPPPDLAAVPDAVPRPEPRARLGNPPFYDVLGRRYVVLASADGYVERGVASWYGPDFHGVATSTGEPYDMYGMTAAHKTLPLPSYVRVTNLRNGRSVVVRVNDRGPFVGNRIIDLSYTAAMKLDMIRDGTALVEVRAVGPGPATSGPLLASTAPLAVQPPAPAAEPAPSSSLLYVQVGAFAEELNASRLVEKLRAAGLANVFVGAKPASHRTLYRVRLGPVASVEEFDRLVARLAALGVADARLALD